jgi:2'-hydroxyisoflavone reductase
MQLVHAQDQAAFIVRLLSAGTAGVFNTVGPDTSMTFAQMIDACATAAGTDPEVVWAPGQLLRAHRVSLPLSVPAKGSWDGVFRRSNARARAEGFRNRPFVDTAADTLAWDRTRDAGVPIKNAPTAEQEAEILALL